MRDFVNPRNVQPEVADAFQQIRLILQNTQIPLLNDKRSIRSIREETSAYHVDSDGCLYRWTKIRGKLYKEKVAIEDVSAEINKAIEENEGSSADVIRQVDYTPQAPRKVVFDYTRVESSPQAVSFGTQWYRLTDSEELETLSDAELPSDVSFSPESPSSEVGKHFVTVTFTAPQYAEGDRIIGRLLVREEGD